MVDADKLANLARIKLDTGEKEKIQKEFESILGYISVLKEADLNRLNKNETVLFKNKNVLREDNKPDKMEKNAENLLDSSVLKSEKHIKVKHVFE